MKTELPGLITPYWLCTTTTPGGKAFFGGQFKNNYFWAKYCSELGAPPATCLLGGVLSRAGEGPSSEQYFSEVPPQATLQAPVKPIFRGLRRRACGADCQFATPIANP